MNDFLNDIRNSVIKLSKKKKILFCVLTCEKLLSNYMSFEEENDWGDHQVLQEAIDMIYQYLINDKLFSNEEISELLERVDAITPHTEDFPGILTSFALDACTSVESTLQFILDDKAEHVMEVVSYAYDTVDMFIQEKENMDSNDREIEERISNDVFMQRERKRQKELLQRMSEMQNDNITDDVINRFRDGQRIIDVSYLQ